jgi:hypothetical protein
MAARGMGVAYTAISRQAVLRHRLGAEERRDLIRDYLVNERMLLTGL